MSTRARVLLISSLVLGMTFAAARTEAQTAVNVGVQIGDFRLAVSNYYHVPEREVVVIHERRIRDEDVPVVLFIAQHAHVATGTIIDLRLRGMSWWSISTRFHLGPEVYYVPVAVAPGPPYGKAYGHYKKDKKQWNTIVLADDDVVNMVHLRFLSDYYHVPPERVIEVRSRNGNFVAVQNEVAHGKGKGQDQQGDDKHGSDKKSSSSSNGKGGQSSSSQGSSSQGSKTSKGRGRGGL